MIKWVFGLLADAGAPVAARAGLRGPPLPLLIINEEGADIGGGGDEGGIPLMSPAPSCMFLKKLLNLEFLLFALCL